MDKKQNAIYIYHMLDQLEIECDKNDNDMPSGVGDALRRMGQLAVEEKLYEQLEQWAGLDHDYMLQLASNYE